MENVEMENKRKCDILGNVEETYFELSKTNKIDYIVCECEKYTIKVATINSHHSHEDIIHQRLLVVHCVEIIYQQYLIKMVRHQDTLYFSLLL